MGIVEVICFEKKSGRVDERKNGSTILLSNK
jgi:hypothetical protein